MNLPSARTEGLIIEELTDEALVYDLERHKAHCLNSTAFLVWRNCDGKRTVSDIAAILETELHAPVSDELVWLAIDQLSKDNLLRERVTTPMSASGVARRKMMKRMGVAAVVAVPVVTSLLAPTAAQAGTCLPTGSACTSGTQCCNGICNGTTCA
ncbi:MAG: hypothetical protein NVSMB56_05020 [Pyrinomonadaceae bacterium]